VTQLEDVLTQLPGWVGTARQLADRAGLDRRDSTFRRALARAVEERALYRTRAPDGEDVYHPKHVASGFGAAIAYGIHTARTEAFRVMSANAGMVIGSGDPNKVTTRHKRPDGSLTPALERRDAPTIKVSQLTGRSDPDPPRPDPRPKAG
jgi:hypothetical protein